MKAKLIGILSKLSLWQWIAIIASIVVIIGGIITTVVLLNLDSTPASTETSSQTSSEVSSQVSSEVSSEISSEVSSEASSQVSSEATSSKSTTKTPKKPAAQSNKMPDDYQERFAQYYAKNKDIIGWIKLDGTNLNYPVAKGKDNSYYLNHNIYKATSGWGVPYMDYRITVTKDYQSTNTILYGHSDDKRTLQLSAIKGYRKVDFYKKHPVIELDTVFADAKYKVVAFFIENTKPGTKFFEYQMFIDSSSETEFNSYIDNAKKRSYINTTVDVKPSDKLLTISTCQDTNRSNYNRLVLVARKVRPDEDTSVDTSGATQNSKQVLPK